MEKLKHYYRSRWSEAGGHPVMWGIPEPPETKDGLVGDVKVENEYHVLIVYFEDHEARTFVTAKFRDAAAIAQEWMIPAVPPESDPLR